MMASPGQILNVGTQPGQNHFNIGIGFPSGHVDHSPQEIESGYSSNPEFIGVDTDAWCRFRVPMNGGTTSSGTKYPRSELREFAENSTDHAAFDGTADTHYMQGISRFVHLPPNKPWAVICQIHDASSDLIRVQSEGTSTSSLKLVARHTPPGGSEIVTTVKSSISLMEEISWKLEVIDGNGTLYINGSSVLTFDAGATGLYFKAGCYAQSNDSIDAASEYAAVDIKAGSFETWHTGYAAPTTGTSGGGGGGSSQTLGVGGIPAPAPASNVVLVGANSSSTLTITTDGMIYDGQGHTVPKIDIEANNVTVQNFYVNGGTNSGIYSFGSNNIIQNNDISNISEGGTGDINAITFFGDGTHILYNNIDNLVQGDPGGSHTDGVQTWNTPSKRSSSNVLILGNRFNGPPDSDPAYLHQGVMAEGKDSTDGGGGGTGTSQNWLVDSNWFATYGNQCLKFDDIDSVSITRNTFAGSATKIVETGTLSVGTTYYSDNNVTGSYGSVGLSVTSGSGPSPSGWGYSGGGGTTPQSLTFTMGFGSCIDAADSEALSACAALDPDYFLQCGDVYYADGESGYATHWDAKFQAPHYTTLLNGLEAKGPLSERHIYLWSDHDAFANDAYGPTYFTSANTAYRSYPLWSGVQLPSEGIYRSFEIGRILFIGLDERTFKDVQTKTDGPDKTVLGATQKAWFQNLIAQSNHALIVIMGDIPITTPTQAGDDSWAGYDDERQWMQGVLESSSAKFIRLSGNQHCLARTANTYGYDRAWQAAPLNKATKVSAGGDGMDETYPTNANEGSVKQLFGMVTFTDDGNQITVDFKGYEATSATASTQRISDSIVVSAPGGLPGGGGGTPGGGGTGGGSGPTVKVGQVATHPTSGPVTPAFPTASATGEYVLIEVHSRYGHDVTCDNPDWQRWAYKRGTDSALYAGSISVYGKRLEDGDTPPTFSTDASNGGLLAICSSWGDYSPVASAVDSDPALPVVAPSALVANPNSIAAYFVAQDNDYSLTAPSNGSGIYALTAQSGPDGGDGMAVAAAWRIVTTVGSTGTCSWTSTGTGNPKRWTAATLAMVQLPDPPPPPPEAHVLYGIDVSEQQAGLDLAEAKTEGVSFVLAKLGQGAGLEVHPDKTRLQFAAHADTAFSQFVTDAAANALPLGAVWLVGNSEPPQSQAARAAAAIGDLTIPVIMHWQEGSGDYAQLEACVLAFRAAGMSVRMLYFNSDYWAAQELPTLGPLLLTGAVHDRIRNLNAGTLQVLLGPVTLNPLDAWDSYGFLTTKMLRYAQTAIVAGVPRVSALAFQTEDTAALAALLAHATGPDPVNPPVPPPGPAPGGEPQPSDEPPHLIDVQYEFHFADLRTGLPFGTLPLRQVRLSTVLGGEAGALSALIPVYDPDVRALNPWAVAVPRRTALYVRRIEIYPPGTIANRDKVIWGGIVWDLDPRSGEGVLELHAATFESYAARRYIDEDRFYSQVEQTAIHGNLLTYFQIYREGADIGIGSAALTTGRKRDRTYLAKDNHQLLQVLQEISRVEDGFDWYIEAFREAVSGRFIKHVVYGYPRLGRRADGPTGPLRLRHYTDGSPTNLVAPPKVKRQGTVVDNEMIGIGKSTGEEQLRVVVGASDLGRPEIQSGFPLLQGVHSDTSVSVPETLRENAGAALRKGWVSEILLTEVTLQGTTAPTLHDIGLGDDVLVDTDDATWPAPVTLAGRVYAISVALAEGDNSEQVTLTLAGSGLTT